MFAQRIFRRASPSNPFTRLHEAHCITVSKGNIPITAWIVGAYRPCLSGDTTDCFRQDGHIHSGLRYALLEASIRCPWFDARPIPELVTGISECLYSKGLHYRNGNNSLR